MAVPLLLAVGGCIIVSPSIGLTASKSLIAVGTKACVSGISGALSSSLMKSVKCVVSDTISWLTVSTSTLSSRTHAKVAVS